MTNQQQNTNTNPATILEFARLQLAAEVLYDLKNAIPNWEITVDNPNIGNLSFDNLITKKRLQAGNDHIVSQNRKDIVNQNKKYIILSLNSTPYPFPFYGLLYRFPSKSIRPLRTARQHQPNRTHLPHYQPNPLPMDCP